MEAAGCCLMDGHYSFKLRRSHPRGSSFQGITEYSCLYQKKRWFGTKEVFFHLELRENENGEMEIGVDPIYGMIDKLKHEKRVVNQGLMEFKRYLMEESPKKILFQVKEEPIIKKY